MILPDLFSMDNKMATGVGCKFDEGVSWRFSKHSQENDDLLDTEDLPEEGDDLPADFLLPAGNEVVFSVDFDQGGPVAVGFKVLFAAPHGDDGVLGSMEQQDGALVCGGRAIDVQLLGGEEVFAAELHGAPAADEFRRVGGIEAGVEELAALAGLFDNGAGGEEDHAGGDGAACGGQPAGGHRRDNPALRVAEKADLRHVGQRFRVFPDGQRIGDFLFDRHVLHPAFALSVPIEIEPDGGNAGLGERLREGGHGVVVLAGEDAVHQQDHGTAVRRRVEAVGQGDLHGEPAFRTGNRKFPGLSGEKTQK